MSRQSAGKRRAEITRRRKGKKPNKSAWGGSLWGRTPNHRLLYGNQKVPLGDGEFLMAAGSSSVCGKHGRNHHMVYRRDLGYFVCINRGCPANC